MDDARMEWKPITGPAGPGEPHALYVGGTEAARMVERIGGGWFALLRYPNGTSVPRPCSSFEAGKLGCERWAARHMDALLRKAEVHHLEWLAQQTWRGADCASARVRLEALGGGEPAGRA